MASIFTSLFFNINIPHLFSFYFVNKITDDQDRAQQYWEGSGVCSEQGGSRFSSVLDNRQHNGNLDFSGSQNTSVRDVFVNSEACLFGKWFATSLQEISLGWNLRENPETLNSQASLRCTHQH